MPESTANVPPADCCSIATRCSNQRKPCWIFTEESRSTKVHPLTSEQVLFLDTTASEKYLNTNFKWASPYYFCSDPAFKLISRCFSLPGSPLWNPRLRFRHQMWDCGGSTRGANRITRNKSGSWDLATGDIMINGACISCLLLPNNQRWSHDSTTYVKVNV